MGGGKLDFRGDSDATPAAQGGADRKVVGHRSGWGFVNSARPGFPRKTDDQILVESCHGRDAASNAGDSSVSKRIGRSIARLAGFKSRGHAEHGRGSVCSYASRIF